jgi:Zn-dependent M28 family amino/carboxypeptidase
MIRFDGKRWAVLSVYVFFGLALVFGVVCFAVARPSFSSNKPSAMQVESARLEAHVRMLSETFHPRTYSDSHNLEKCAQYIYDHFRSAGADTISFQGYDAAGTPQKNVVARFGSASGPRSVVGAHYDSAHGTPGADDNASGVAGLIELAYLLGKHPVSGTVELVAYSTEEPPFFRTADMGSAHHAAALAKEGVKVGLMISLEMIGYFSEKENSQRFPVSGMESIYSDRGDFIAVISRMRDGALASRVKRHMQGASSLEVYSLSAPASVPGVDFSDHLNYWNHQFPAIMVTDTSFYRNPHYHEATDTAEQLDYKRMSQVVVAVYEAVAGLGAG